MERETKLPEYDILKEEHPTPTPRDHGLRFAVRNSLLDMIELPGK